LLFLFSLSFIPSNCSIMVLNKIGSFMESNQPVRLHFITWCWIFLTYLLIRNIASVGVLLQNLTFILSLEFNFLFQSLGFRFIGTQFTVKYLQHFSVHFSHRCQRCLLIVFCRLSRLCSAHKYLIAYCEYIAQDPVWRRGRIPPPWFCES
jgi:hypothetical protein